MADDFVIRGSLLVDGTGAVPRRADVAVRDGRIVAVGDVSRGSAATEIDASGCWLTPGFIDPHTHLDAQLCWDPSAAPTSLHGVTSVVLGLCGFGVAPCRDGGGDYLLRSLERVEEIPYASTRLGVPFRWSSWADYFAFLAEQPLGVNVAGFVPHSALRHFAMGERARGEVASNAEREAMVAELARAIAAGAVGLASSRGPNHEDAYGDPVPSRFADVAELRALVGACAGRLWQINVETKFARDASALLEELETYVGWSRAAGARLTWSPFHAEPGDAVWQEVLDHNRAVNESGQIVAPQVAPLPISLLLRFDEPSVVGPLLGLGPVLDRFFELSAGERAAYLIQPTVREAMRAARPHSKMPFPVLLADCSVLHSPSRPGWNGRNLGEIAAGEGTHAADLLCDLAIADDLATLIDVPLANSDLEGAVRLIEDPYTVLALGDSGAHVMSTTQYRYPTYLLANLVRDRGLLPVEIAVERLTRRPAQLLGLAGRGVVAPGAIADLCVIDPDELGLGPVEIRRDLPGEAPRLFQPGRGYRGVWVGGVRTIESDESTGARPGTPIAPGR